MRMAKRFLCVQAALSVKKACLSTEEGRREREKEEEEEEKMIEAGTRTSVKGNGKCRRDSERST